MENSLGSFETETGIVSWNNEKISFMNKFEIPKDCRLCKLLPLCGGPCRKKNTSWSRDDCFLNEIGMSVEEYALIQLKIELTNKKIREKKHENIVVRSEE